MSIFLKVILTTFLSVWGSCLWASYSSITEQEVEAWYQENQQVLEKINEYNQSKDLEFIEYEEQYFDYFAQAQISTPKPESIISSLVKNNKVVLLSDIHASKKDQQNAMTLLKMYKDQDLAVVLEWIDRRYEPLVQKYFNNKINLSELLTAIEDGGEWPFELKGYGFMLSKIKDMGFRVILPEQQGKKRNIQQRDAEILKQVVKDQTQHKDSKYLVVYGAYHILGKDHLYERFNKQYQGQVVAFTSYADKVFWSVMTEHLSLERARFVNIHENIYYWMSDHPLKRNRMHLSDLRKTGLSWAEASREFDQEEF